MFRTPAYRGREGWGGEGMGEEGEMRGDLRVMKGYEGLAPRGKILSTPLVR